MGSIKDKAKYLLDTKTLIRAALLTAGVNIPEDMPFRQYANFIQGLAPDAEEAFDDYMRIDNLMDVHQFGGTLLSNDSISNIYNMFQNIAKKTLALQEGENNE